ncbi:hypothetical protein MUN81_07920 [Hymenobacter sp. 5317J-9]|uniref:hypothetical protein n=1 Tax=Hymenobacter sp. 5317J-9 TaxID=2932250 RepID=UPI001FD6B1A7|nr:hypothetical protein [Hymenobacter sp. 5317J-9]UOQ99415.1 hypothetical protein MUN81_07920 [Hymenobacter sp. 5317J-9]
MKSAAEYLKGHVFEARRPRRELQPVVAHADAVQAIEHALADAEKYRYLLMRALRHTEDAQPTAAPVRLADIRPAFPTTETPVLPMYPALAA